MTAVATMDIQMAVASAHLLGALTGALKAQMMDDEKGCSMVVSLVEMKDIWLV